MFFLFHQVPHKGEDAVHSVVESERERLSNWRLMPVSSLQLFNEFKKRLTHNAQRSICDQDHVATSSKTEVIDLFSDIKKITLIASAVSIILTALTAAQI